MKVFSIYRHEICSHIWCSKLRPNLINFDPSMFTFNIQSQVVRKKKKHEIKHMSKPGWAPCNMKSMSGTVSNKDTLIERTGFFFFVFVVVGFFVIWNKKILVRSPGGSGQTLGGQLSLLPGTKKFLRTRNFQGQNQDSPRQVKTASHPESLKYAQHLKHGLLCLIWLVLCSDQRT